MGWFFYMIPDAPKTIATIRTCISKKCHSKGTGSKGTGSRTTNKRRACCGKVQDWSKSRTGASWCPWAGWTPFEAKSTSSDKSVLARAPAEHPHVLQELL